MSGILGSCGQLDILIDIIPCKRIWQINNRSHAFPEALGDKKQFRLEFNSNLKTGTKPGGKPPPNARTMNQFPGREITAANPFLRQAEIYRRDLNRL